MKYIILLASLFLIYTFTKNDDAPPERISSLNPIEFYSTSWCPFYKKARAFLQKNNLSYVEYDIEDDLNAKSKHQKLLGSKKKPGKVGVPLFVINGKIVYGFSEKRLTKAISLVNG
jgi:glutaredoxin